MGDFGQPRVTRRDGQSHRDAGEREDPKVDPEKKKGPLHFTRGQEAGEQQLRDKRYADHDAGQQARVELGAAGLYEQSGHDRVDVCESRCESEPGRVPEE